MEIWTDDLFRSRHILLTQLHLQLLHLPPQMLLPQLLQRRRSRLRKRRKVTRIWAWISSVSRFYPIVKMNRACIFDDNVPSMFLVSSC
jgi:hypothetical protein